LTALQLDFVAGLQQQHISMLSGLPWVRFLSLQSDLDSAVCAKLSVVTSLTELRVGLLRGDAAALATACVSLPRLHTLSLVAGELPLEQMLGVIRQAARSASLRVLEIGGRVGDGTVTAEDTSTAAGRALEVRCSWLRAQE
jgi:hypothetical protein